MPVSMTPTSTRRLPWSLAYEPVAVAPIWRMSHCRFGQRLRGQRGRRRTRRGRRVRLTAGAAACRPFRRQPLHVPGLRACRIRRGTDDAVAGRSLDHPGGIDFRREGGIGAGCEREADLRVLLHDAAAGACDDRSCNAGLCPSLYRTTYSSLADPVAAALPDDGAALAARVAASALTDPARATVLASTIEVVATPARIRLLGTMTPPRGHTVVDSVTGTVGECGLRVKRSPLEDQMRAIHADAGSMGSGRLGRARSCHEYLRAGPAPGPVRMLRSTDRVHRSRRQRLVDRRAAPPPEQLRPCGSQSALQGAGGPVVAPGIAPVHTPTGRTCLRAGDRTAASPRHRNPHPLAIASVS